MCHIFIQVLNVQSAYSIEIITWLFKNYNGVPHILMYWHSPGRAIYNSFTVITVMHTTVISV